MTFLHKLTLEENGGTRPVLNNNEIASLLYHDIFDYPLTASELIDWSTGKSGITEKSTQPVIEAKKGFYFIKGKESIIYKRVLRERISSRKIKIANKAASILKLIPSLKMLAITGALSMKNVSEDSDVDLLIVTAKDSLWTTRLISLVILLTLRFPVRRFGDRNVKDKLCLNMWLDESSLVWPKKDRNIFTAHEICQIVPIVSKDFTYEEFLNKNKWVLDYWPKAVKIKNLKFKINDYRKTFTLHSCIAGRQVLPFTLIEALAYWLQIRHMRGKITGEVVTKTRALFHPANLSEIIQQRLRNLC